MMGFSSILIINTSFIHWDQPSLSDTSFLEPRLSSEVMIAESHVSYFAYSAIKISPDGKYIASAQNTFPGFPADIIIWDFQTK